MSSVPEQNQSKVIADLTYRDYDGELKPPRFRWWVIAKDGMKQAVRKKGFTVWTLLSGYWYLILMVIFFFVTTTYSQLPARAQERMSLNNVMWKDQFIEGFSRSQTLFLILALLVGAGSIANDNRSNALLVYMSKPVRKFDYVFGKWLGIFLPLCAVTAGPMLTFYLYCAMSFRSFGFLEDQPDLILRLFLIIPLPAALHASLMLGVSSLFKQARLAGAAYAGLYFILNFMTALFWIVRTGLLADHKSSPQILETLYYCSIDGLLQGLGKAVLVTPGGVPFGNKSPVPPVPVPNGWVFFAVFLLLNAIGFLLAYRRVRAVEVVN